MEITLSNEQEDLAFSEDRIRTIAKEILSLEGVFCDEISLNFVTVERICQVHQDFFDDPSPTDCISFPIDEDEDEPGPRLLGEVFVCPAVAIQRAEAENGDAFREMVLYLAHGMLHLMGYDDLEPDTLAEMEDAEARHMAHLGSLGLILQSSKD